MHECINMKAAGKNLAEKDSIQITADSGKGDREYYKKDPDQDSQSTVYKTSSCLTKSMQDARKRCVQIKKRADERKRLYVGPGSRTVKQYCPHKRTDTVKTKRAQKSKQKACTDRLPGNIPDTFPIPERLHFSDGRHEHHGSRVCDRSRKKNTRKRQSCKNPVDTE